MDSLNRRRTPKEWVQLAVLVSAVFAPLVYFPLLGVTLKAILACVATSLLIGAAVSIAVDRYRRRRD